jgi:predicted nucleotidyltransferase
MRGAPRTKRRIERLAVDCDAGQQERGLLLAFDRPAIRGIGESARGRAEGRRGVAPGSSARGDHGPRSDIDVTASAPRWRGSEV